MAKSKKSATRNRASPEPWKVFKHIQDVEDVRTDLATSEATVRERLLVLLQDPKKSLLLALKFEQIGMNLESDAKEAQSLLEQINIHATMLVTLSAVEYLMAQPSFKNKIWAAAPGHGGFLSDIWSIDSNDLPEKENRVEAEIFAARDKGNNRKLSKDIKKLTEHSSATDKFVFYADYESYQHYGVFKEKPGDVTEVVVGLKQKLAA